MIVHKHITKIVALAMAVSVCLCLAAMAFSEAVEEALGGAVIAMEYESKLFGTEEIIHINIRIDDGDWKDMLANATAEAYYPCDVEIDGELFCQVGIRPKGNTSLTSIASDPDTDRYSWKLEFDQYVDGQTCFGLDKLVLNNQYADATSMKEALVYDMYQYLGADASLYNYAKVSVNGEYWGLYLALEAVEDSFLLRNYGAEQGELYKPDSMRMGIRGGQHPGSQGFMNLEQPNIGGNGSFWPPQPGDEDWEESLGDAQFGGTPPQEQGEGTALKGDKKRVFSGEMEFAGREPNENGAAPFGTGGFGGVSIGSGGANLNYLDQDMDSYSAIWEGEVTNTTDADHKRVVKALKNISEGVGLEKYMDVENLLKYMAVHVFSVNEDSLSGRMAHNYYLYESDGQLNILPWDYNLAFGGMGEMSEKEGSSATSTVNDAIDNAFSGTKFFDPLMEDEEYHAKYYSYLQQLAEEYIFGGGFEEFYRRVRRQIDTLVETDPTAFYAYEEYEKAVNTLYEVARLRGQSISRQIEGTIPSTEEGQRDSDLLIDASHLDLRVMGAMNQGDRMQNWNKVGMEAAKNESTEQAESLQTDASPFGGGQWPEGFGSSQVEGKISDAGQRFPEGDSETMPNWNFGKTAAGYLILYGACFIVLAVALIFAGRYRRRSQRQQRLRWARSILQNGRTELWQEKREPPLGHVLAKRKSKER